MLRQLILFPNQACLKGFLLFIGECLQVLVLRLSNLPRVGPCFLAAVCRPEPRAGAALLPLLAPLMLAAAGSLRPVELLARLQ